MMLVKVRMQKCLETLPGINVSVRVQQLPKDPRSKMSKYNGSKAYTLH